LLVALIAILAGDCAQAAPLPPFTPVDLCGKVLSQDWSDVVNVPGQPGFSGSLGRERTFPARFRVVLQPYSGIEADTAALINGLLGFEGGTPPTKVLLLLNSPDSSMLEGVHSLCIYGFSIHGDEGGTWTDYARIVIDPR
jgi:hypothetical protein